MALMAEPPISMESVTRDTVELAGFGDDGEALAVIRKEL
jgi:hypothetical protein